MTILKDFTRFYKNCNIQAGFTIFSLNTQNNLQDFADLCKNLQKYARFSQEYAM